MATSQYEWWAISAAAFLAFLLATSAWDVAAIAILGIFIFRMGQRDRTGA